MTTATLPKLEDLPDNTQVPYQEIRGYKRRESITVFNNDGVKIKLSVSVHTQNKADRIYGALVSKGNPREGAYLSTSTEKYYNEHLCLLEACLLARELGIPLLESIKAVSLK